jgi:hypothetical protein
MARPSAAAESAVPLSMTSPFLASTSKVALAVSLSAWILPFTIVSITSSSVEPVGAPTTVSFVRTIVTPRSRSDCSSVGPNRHSVMRVVMSVLEAVAVRPVSVAVVAPVVLVEPLVAPIVLLVDALLLGYVELELGDVLVSVDAARDESVELVLLGDVLLVVEDVSGDVLLELGVVELPYVELVPVVPVDALLLGLVDDVVFKLPLVLSCVVLVLLGLLLLPYVEPLELDGEVEEVELLDGEVAEVPVP